MYYSGTCIRSLLYGKEWEGFFFKKTLGTFEKSMRSAFSTSDKMGDEMTVRIL